MKFFVLSMFVGFTALLVFTDPRMEGKSVPTGSSLTGLEDAVFLSCVLFDTFSLYFLLQSNENPCYYLAGKPLLID